MKTPFRRPTPPLDSREISFSQIDRVAKVLPR